MFASTSAPAPTSFPTLSVVPASSAGTVLPAGEATPHGASRPSRSSVRLTPRGRRALRLVRTVVLLGIAAAVGCVLALSFGQQAAAGTAAPDGAGDGYATVVVEEGQSLWSIAAAAAGDDDPRDVMHRIAEVNGLQQSVVHPGQELAVPSR